jgi:hypothetical protein
MHLGEQRLSISLHKHLLATTKSTTENIVLHTKAHAHVLRALTSKGEANTTIKNGITWTRRPSDFPRWLTQHSMRNGARIAKRADARYQGLPLRLS